MAFHNTGQCENSQMRMGPRKAHGPVAADARPEGRSNVEVPASAGVCTRKRGFLDRNPYPGVTRCWPTVNERAGGLVSTSKENSMWFIAFFPILFLTVAALIGAALVTEQ